MAVLGLTAVISVGTLGYWFLGGKQYSFVDCLYMTIITVTTIGYGEIIDMSGNPAGRIFTIFLAVSGIGIVTFILGIVVMILPTILNYLFGIYLIVIGLFAVIRFLINWL